MKWKIHAHLAINKADFATLQHMHITYCWSHIFTSSWQSSDCCFAKKRAYNICLYKKTLLCVCSSACEGGCLCFIACCNGQEQRGVYEVVILQNAREESLLLIPLENDGCLFSPCPTNPVFLSWDPYLLPHTHNITRCLPLSACETGPAGRAPSSVLICSSYGRLLASRQTGMFGL